jgi:ferritin-like metal-binding protein YciE
MAEKKLNESFLWYAQGYLFAERQILKNLPKMAKAAKSGELKKAFLTHRDQKEQHVERLQEMSSWSAAGAGEDKDVRSH